MSTATSPPPRTQSPSQIVALKLITPSPTNPRKRFDERALSELADSIKKHGVLQPILVRPTGKDGTIYCPYEIVAGERRYRAAIDAGLTEMPVNVLNNATDQDVLEIQVIENLQRQDLHELEEAEGYEQLMKLPGYGGVEVLAAKVGKSKAYVYARLKLCALCPEARKAFYAGKLNASTALLIARIPVPELQKEALGSITAEHFHGGPMSYREAADLIQQDFMLRLSEAPFSATDAQLLPKAGACSTCPKRTGNQRELFDDVKSADVCTDPVCFKEKKKIWTDRRLAEAKANGSKVITGAEAKKVVPYEHSPNQLKGYMDLAATCYDDDKHRKLKKVLGENCPPPVLLVDPHSGDLREVLSQEQVNRALKETGVLSPRARASQTTDDHGARQRAAEKKAKRKAAVLRGVLDAIVQHVPPIPTRFELELIANKLFKRIWNDTQKKILNRWHWDASGRSVADMERTVSAKLSTLSAEEILRFLVDISLFDQTAVGYNDDAGFKSLAAAARHYQLDPVKIRKRLEDEQREEDKAKEKPTPRPSAAAAKKKSAKKSKKK